MKHVGVEGLTYFRNLIQPAKDTVKSLVDHPAEKGIAAGVMTVITTMLNENLLGFLMLVVLVVFDQALGTMVALRKKAFSSAKFRNGLLKVLVYAMVIVAFHLLEHLSPLLSAVNIDNYAVIYLAVTEALSIVENSRELTGLGLPSWLSAILRKVGK